MCVRCQIDTLESVINGMPDYYGLFKDQEEKAQIDSLLNTVKDKIDAMMRGDTPPQN